MGGGKKSSSSSHSLSSDYVYLSHTNPNSNLRSRPIRKDYEDEEEKPELDYGSESEVAASISLDYNTTDQASTLKQVLGSYTEIQRRSNNFSYFFAAKDEIRSYFPGKWAENVDECDAPETTTLLLVGPKGCGKSSLVNRISKVFESDKFGVDRAQVSYNSSGDGTCFLQEYRIPKHSKSLCLFDTRSLSDDSSENMKELEKWITGGVRHGDPVIRDSDSESLKSRIEDRDLGDNVSEKMVNFVIFVVDGLSVLKFMDGDDDEAKRQYNDMLLTTFNYPFLSFRDDKPVIAVTHGDILSLPDRARVRIHLGELLGIHPTKQIFDIPDNYDRATDMAIIDMLRYALEHADRNLYGKQQVMMADGRSLMEKVLIVLLVAAWVLLILVMGSYLVGARFSGGIYSCSSQNYHPPTHSCSAQNHRPAPPVDTKMDHRPPPGDHLTPTPDTKMDLQTSPPDSKTDPRPLPNPPSVQPKRPSLVRPKKKHPPSVRPKKQPFPSDSEENWYAFRSRVRALIRKGLQVYD